MPPAPPASEPLLLLDDEVAELPEPLVPLLELLVNEISLPDPQPRAMVNTNKERNNVEVRMGDTH